MHVPGMARASWEVDEKYRPEQLSRREQAVVTFDDLVLGIPPSTRRPLRHRVRELVSDCAYSGRHCQSTAVSANSMWSGRSDGTYRSFAIKQLKRGKFSSRLVRLQLGSGPTEWR